MRGGVAQASIFLLSTLAPAVSYASPTLHTTTNALTQDDSVLLWRDSDGVYVQFEASCASCSLDNEDAWPVNLFIGSTNGLCHNATVSVNGQELSHRWEGPSATGSGVIPSSPYNGSTEIRATWYSTCVTAPLGAPNGQNAHVFTFIFDTDRSHGLEDDIGFTISFGNDTRNDNGIKVLRLSNFPVSFGDIPNWGEGDDTSDPIDSNTGSSPDPGLASLEVQLEAELQRLQVLQYELQQLHNSVALEKKKIFHLLKQDCEPLLAKWEQCEDFFCYLKSSWQKVPEFYWSMRYRFGLLGPGRVIPICRLIPEEPPDHDADETKPSLLPSHPVATPSKHAIPTYSETSSSSSTSTIPSTTTEPPRPIITRPPSKPESHLDTNPNHPDINEVVIPLPIYSPTKKFIRSCAIILLIALIIGLFVRVVRHSTAFRRRRRDIASRREELRTRRAYRNAARRLRWRQWWQGRFYFQAASVASSHSLPEFQHVRGTNYPGDENNRLNPREIRDNDSTSEISTQSSDTNDEEPQQRMMQAEILGLRRVLEYVGQLVGSDDTTSTSRSSSARHRNRSRSRSVPPPYEYPMRHNRNASVGDNNHPRIHTLEIRRSVTPGVISGGPSSPRASTMFSLETGSLVTLETLDTLDSGTAPPSYHP
ncbi:hypothetical protein TMatcc_001433 [Talaromyces marneffei ATCC 18224]|nr:hypothetical protein EYB25_005370 [Talaromyces marneffei]